MKKCYIGFVFIALALMIPTNIQAEEVIVQLTEEQKQELAELHTDVLEKKKAVVAKYVEFGVFNAEKAEKINAMFDRHYQKLEENDFIPKWDGKKKHRH
jgi:hypothetical protein